jgi:dipeptidyl aminopeptidase/acylaminoacyl peptidase
MRRAVLVLILISFVLSGSGGYQRPPKEILDILNAPMPPVASVNPARTHVIFGEVQRTPSIQDVAQPILRIAGLRINPSANSPQTLAYTIRLRIRNLSGGPEVAVNLPPNPKLSEPLWSPDGKQFSVTNLTTNSVELWIGDTNGRIRRVIGGLNTAFGNGPRWMPDSRTLLVKLVPAGRGKPPVAPSVPAAPVIQESAGKSAPVRTFQDLLANPHDEALFDYYATSQLALLDITTGKAVPIGAPGLYFTAEPSPDGKLILTNRVHGPYSYVHPHFFFPRDIEVLDRSGKVIYTFAKLPLAEVPIDGVPTGPRNVSWRATEPATLVWVEALDDGNPKKKVPHRDLLLMAKAPFQGKPLEIAKVEHRMADLEWLETRGRAFLTDYDRDKRWIRTFLIAVDEPAATPKQIWSRSINERYEDPGQPVMRQLPNGHRVVMEYQNSIFLSGPGASPNGDRPFFDRFSLETLKAERLFQSDEKAYQTVPAPLTSDGSRLLIRSESTTEPPNYFVRAGGEMKQISDYRDPAPQLRKIRKRLVTYKRPDGVDLSFTLYLPPDYKEGTKLPTVVWAYPREFTDASTAGQVTGSTERFTLMEGPTHMFFLLAGYAILDGASMPVVGDPETVNNTYIEQIVSSAKAAIERASEMGVTDPNRVGVGGHSYGAFMTANLLAHSDLFKAGIARSGAYNRTLTPFGFQAERRTLWEAPDTYLQMSPFMHAQKISEPVLLIHGEADNNPGTFPVQSERMYQAVRGNGGTVRLVMLPHESHGYVARESIEHTLFEMISWFDRYVKHADTKTH